MVENYMRKLLARHKEKKLYGKRIFSNVWCAWDTELYFRSNDLQEIIGASNLVENIIIDGLESIITGQSDWNREEFLTDWKNDNGTEFIDDNSVKMQVLFIGGGNGYVLFRTKNICSKVNRLLAKYILEHTYSLTLAVAICEKVKVMRKTTKLFKKNA